MKSYFQYSLPDGEADNLSKGETARVLLYMTWFLKPVYGFLGDYFFPFYYRVKGYVVIWIMTAVIATTTMVFLVPKVPSDEKNGHLLLGVEILNFLALGFIDAVCRSLRLPRGNDLHDSQTRKEILSVAV